MHTMKLSQNLVNSYIIEPSQLNGHIFIPSSKSQTLRAILFAAMAKGKSTIHRYLHSPDTDAMIAACMQFGAKCTIYPDTLEIEGTQGQIMAESREINAGNSGIVLRFCTALAALHADRSIITGDYSIRNHRPMQALLDGLSQLGVRTFSLEKQGYAPLAVQGPILPGKIIVNGEDSQPVSALLIAAAFAQGPIIIDVMHAGEKPWVYLTLDWFTRLGIFYEQISDFSFRLSGRSCYEGFSYEVPGDLSSAAFPIAAALITGSEITLQNVDMADKQGDKKLISLFQQMGALIIVDEKRKEIVVKGERALHGISIDVNDCIDALTILAVVGCFAKGKTEIRNAAIAKQKECDRIHCITNELKKMGAIIYETADGLSIEESCLSSASVHSYDDHRMAMSLVVAAMGAKGQTVVTSVDCIAKTFPSFASDFSQLGAHIRPQEVYFGE
jgi:3-phosphoshikimate 1-carboxyvinyltransferase